MCKFELFKGTNGQYYFHLKAENGEIIAASQGYASKQGAETGIAAVRRCAPIAQTADLT
jgi:uncharacterized protein